MNKKILIIDDDEDFTSYLKRAGENFGYAIEVANSIVEARTKLKKGQFDAFVIDGELPDGNGIDLYKELVQNNPEHIKFAFVSVGFNSPKDYSFLKGELGFDLVLNKPLQISTVQSLFKILVEDPILTEDEILFEDLGRNFQKAAPAKIVRLSDLAHDFFRSGNEESLTDFRKIIHRLAGTASSFGLGQVTEMCRQLDMRILDLQESKEWFKIEREELDEFVDELMLAFQFPNWTRSQSAEIQNFSVDIVLVSKDPLLITRFQKSSINHHLHLKIVQNENEYYEFQTKQIDDKASYFFDTGLWDEVNEFKDLHKEIKSDFNCVLIVKEDVKDSILMDHLDVGKVNILPYESNLRYLTWFIYQHLHHPMKVHSKVLVWGTESQKEVLKNILDKQIDKNIEWNAISESHQILKEANPLVASVVVVLDSEAKDFKKIKHLRADDRSTNIKVMVISKNYSETREVLAIESGANAYFESHKIQSISRWISSHIKLEMAQASKINKQGSNGVLSFGGFLQRGLETISKAVRTNDRFTIVRLGIRNVNKLNKEYGNDFVVALMSELGLKIASRLRLSDLVALAQEGEFIALLENTNKKDAYPLIERIIAELTYDLSERPEKCELTASMVSYPEDGASLHLLLNRSNEVFKRAMIGREGAVLSWSESNRKQIHKERGVLIVEPDIELGQMLEFSLKAKGWPVRLVHKGDDALSVLKEGYEPIMILSERILPEGDGVDLLKEINAFSEKKYLWFFLSTKGTNEDMVQGLKSGAKDYIVKPFNLEVLMAKIKNFLEN